MQAENKNKRGKDKEANHLKEKCCFLAGDEVEWDCADDLMGFVNGGLCGCGLGDLKVKLGF